MDCIVKKNIEMIEDDFESRYLLIKLQLQINTK